jgi:hypothetical protein
VSKRLNQKLSFWLDLQEHLKAATFQMGGVPLSPRDSFTWAHALTLFGTLLEDLKIRENAPSIAMYIKAIAQLDVGVVASTLKNADTYLLGLTTEAGSQSESFIQSLNDDQLLVLDPVLPDLRYMKLSLDPGLFRRTHQVLAFLSHVSLRDVYYNVLDDFIKTDVRIPDPPDTLCEGVRAVLKRWLKGFRVVHFPHHGPGATSDGGGGTAMEPLPGNHSPFAKYVRVEADSLLRYVWQKNGACSIDRVLPPVPKVWHRGQCNRVSRFQAVPKTILKRRVICMEPSGMQYFQQAVKESVYDYIGHHHFLRRRIDLPNQETNRHQAYLASITGEYCTIDLSAASDSVGWALVKRCFASTPLLPWLFATRSRACETPYGVIPLRKFATMGSALTFPVESLLFAAICQYSAEVGADTHPWWVYGDDIIVHHSIVQDVVRNLESAGFTVNRDKSYYDVGPGQFRESCGGEYLNGYDVAPLRVSRWFKGPSAMTKSPDVISSLVALANHCYARHYRTTRQVVLSWIVTLPKHLLPAWGNTPSAVNGPGLANPRDVRLVRKAPETSKGESLQRLETRVGVGEMRADKWIDSIYPDLAFFHWQIMAAYGLTAGCAIGTYGSLRLKSRWAGLTPSQSLVESPLRNQRGRFLTSFLR